MDVHESLCFISFVLSFTFSQRFASRARRGKIIIFSLCYLTFSSCVETYLLAPSSVLALNLNLFLALRKRKSLKKSVDRVVSRLRK